MQYYNSISSKQKSLGKLGIGLTKSKVKTIFQEIPKLLTFHQECLPDFEKYFTTGDSTYRSNVIKKKSRVMRMYGDFIINMTSATDIITEYEDYFCVRFSLYLNVCCFLMLFLIQGIERARRHREIFEFSSPHTLSTDHSIPSSYQSPHQRSV